MREGVIAVDLGGTHTRVGVLGSEGDLLAGALRFPTPGPRRWPDRLLGEIQTATFDQVASAAETLRRRHRDLRLGWMGVALGAVVTHDGVVENASVLWHRPARGFDVAAELRRRLPGLEILVINDISAAAWRYHRLQRFLLITVSTGVGNKVFDADLATPYKLVLDAAGLGGEMGHVQVSPMAVARALPRARALAVEAAERFGDSLLANLASGPTELTAAHLGAAAVQGDALARGILDTLDLPYCECGNVADLCSYTSGPAVERLARRRARHRSDFQASKLAALCGGRVEGIDTHALAAAAREDDPFTRGVLTESTRYLALRILQVVADLGLERVLVTGGFANGVGEPYFGVLRDNLVECAHASGFFTRWTEEDLRRLVRPCPDHDDDALLGVGLFVRERQRWFQAAVKPIGEARLEIVDRRRQRCGAGQAVCRTLFAGICSTDIQIYRGVRRCEPGVLGHECVAEVLEVGAGIEGLAPGDLLAVNPNNPLDSADKFGHSREGFFRQIFTIDEDLLDKSQVLVLPPGVTPGWVLLETLACVLHAQNRIDRSLAGRDVVVAGAGINGLLHAAVARRRGARRVILVNRSPARLRLAARLGVVTREETLLLDPVVAGETADGVRRRLGRGADILILALAGNGGPQVASLLLEAVGGGGVAHLFGGFLPGSVLELDGQPAIDCWSLREAGARRTIDAGDGRRIDLVGSRGSQARDLRVALGLCAAGELELDRFITHRISLGALPSAIEELVRDGRIAGRLAVRAVVDMSLPGKEIKHLASESGESRS